MVIIRYFFTFEQCANRIFFHIKNNYKLININLIFLLPISKSPDQMQSMPSNVRLVEMPLSLKYQKQTTLHMQSGQRTILCTLCPVT